MIKYLGSKRLLLPQILESVGALPGVRSVLDLFSGTSRVGHALKRAGYRVIANDHNAYALALARCYVEADLERHGADAERVIAELRSLPGRAGGGYFTENFCLRSRFIHPSNGERIDAMRERIEAMDLEEPLRSVVLVSLMEAADRVDSTTGLQMAYLKDWAPRALNPIDLRVPDLLPRAAHGPGEAHGLDALDAAAALHADAAYIDPPYNQHSYLSNYHVWETLVRWDAPATYGAACKRADCRTRKSPFNLKREALSAFTRLIESVRADHLIVSFSDEGYLTRRQIEAALASRAGEEGNVREIRVDYKRYVGAQIGIYNPSGVKVGTPGRLRNVESIYIVSPARPVNSRVPVVETPTSSVAARSAVLHTTPDA